MKKPLFALCLLTLTLAAAELPAADGPRRGARDRRVVSYVYDPQQVYALTTAYGFITTVYFADYESVRAVDVGDPVGFQVLQPAPNALNVKPVARQAASNMEVITSHRRYTFELASIWVSNARDPRLTWTARFRYLDDERAADERRRREQAAVIETATAGPADWNVDYSFAGDKTIAPTHVYDDGERTYFRFARHSDLPALFLVNPDLTESIVNWRREGKFLVVDRVARQFTVRRGSRVACVFNEAFVIDAVRPDNAVPEASRPAGR